jgi:hypothetical protein
VSARRPHEPEQLTVFVSRGPGGRLILRTPLTPGWAFPATCPAELARGIEQAWTECALAAYARLRGALYELAETEEVIPPEAYAHGAEHPAETPDEVEAARRRKRARHPATHEPEQWTELSDGGWLSPTGRRYGPDTKQVRAVVASRGTRRQPG